MTFKPNLKINEVISNRELTNIFSCGNTGGMRKSNKNKTLVLIADHTKSIYEDIWQDNILHYTGMGRVGNQKINWRSNKTLHESKNNGFTLYLFEVFLPNEYIFRGEVILNNEPYQSEQFDINNNKRIVWVFPLKLKYNNAYLDIDIINKNEIFKRNNIRKLDINKLKENAIKTQNKYPSRRKVITSRYVCSKYISEYAIRRANGICELCEEHAPFNYSDGEPYLESYRIKNLSKNGSDMIDNVVALCPNCRAKMQILNLEEDVNKLKNKAKLI